MLTSKPRPFGGGKSSGRAGAAQGTLDSPTLRANAGRIGTFPLDRARVNPRASIIISVRPFMAAPASVARARRCSALSHGVSALP
jgi:hypothetical protein